MFRIRILILVVAVALLAVPVFAAPCCATDPGWGAPSAVWHSADWLFCDYEREGQTPSGLLVLEHKIEAWRLDCPAKRGAPRLQTERKVADRHQLFSIHPAL